MVITTQTLHVKALGHDINVHQLLTNYRLGIGPVKNYGLEREAPLSHHQRVDKVNTSMKINEDTEVKLDLKTVVSIITITAAFVGMYFTLKSDIEEAKDLPIKRIEYDLQHMSILEDIDELEFRLEQSEELIETMFRLGIELDKELHKIDNDYESNMDDKIKQLEGKINSSNNNKRKKRK
jgi:hypothetical protein